MAENTPNELPGLHDVFDVSSNGSSAQPNEAVDAEPEQTDQQWQSEAGLIAAPPAAEVASPTKLALSVGEPSRPLLGRLPLARVVPQDVHSVMDYVNAGGVLAGAFLTSCPKAKAASWVMGTSGIAASSVTDYKLSLAKVLPIEAHETIDYAWGLTAIAAPFVLGYRKTAPHVAALHIALGLGTILASLFTDYHAYRGVGRRAAA
ncbi:MAG: hypothetical protein K0R38_6776 [Polyangiaceae bacterium]|jgi:hypothetical protein|nr:hypothetical protein [Polyangiaceae bacterium]